MRRGRTKHHIASICPFAELADDLAGTWMHNLNVSWDCTQEGFIGKEGVLLWIWPPNRTDRFDCEHDARDTKKVD